MTTPEDHQAIVDVTVAYCWAIDTHDWDALDDVFLPDAIADLSRRLEGREAIKDRIRETLTALDDSQHLIGTHQIAVDGDRATSRCYLQAQHVRHDADGGSTFMFGGRYEDDLVRTPDGWRIAHRRIVRMWTDGNPAVTVR